MSTRQPGDIVMNNIPLSKLNIVYNFASAQASLWFNQQLAEAHADGKSHLLGVSGDQGDVAVYYRATQTLPAEVIINRLQSMIINHDLAGGVTDSITYTEMGRVFDDTEGLVDICVVTREPGSVANSRVRSLATGLVDLVKNSDLPRFVEPELSETIRVASSAGQPMREWKQPYKHRVGKRLHHRLTGKQYMISGTPDRYRVVCSDGTFRPAYALQPWVTRRVGAAGEENSTLVILAAFLDDMPANSVFSFDENAGISQ